MPEGSSYFGTISGSIYGGFNGVEIYPPKVASGILRPLEIIGFDDLRPVPDTTIYPYRCICYLKIIANDGTDLSGTGWLAAPRTVITAGHCVYRHDHGGEVAQIEIIPGCNGDTPENYPYGSCISTNFAPAEEWRKLKLETHDYGAIFLPEDSHPGNDLGYFGYADWKKEKLEGLELCLSGYPIDDENLQRKPGTQWYDRRKLSEVDDYQLHYVIDTLPGDSGAPLWRVDEEKNRHVVGIHNYGSTGANFATRINDAVFEQIAGWREQGK